MTICMTPHARVRMQQRGICTEALEVLLEIGTVNFTAGGRQIVFLDRKERLRLEKRSSRSIRGRDRLPRIYAITDTEGTVITVGHRYRRLARNPRP